MSRLRKLLAVCLLAAILTGCRGDTQPSVDGPAVVVSYYYINPCSACKEDEKFSDSFYSRIGTDKDGVSIRLMCYNTFIESNEANYGTVCDAHQILADQRKLPMLIIGETVLIGTDDIDKNLKAAFLSEKQRSMAQAEAADPMASRPVYFYVTPCEDCTVVKEFLGTLQASYSVRYDSRTVQSAVAIESHSVADPQGLELARKYFAAWHVPENEQKVPIVFLQDGYLVGKQQIVSGLAEAIVSGRCIGINPPGGEAQLQTYEWPGIFLTGLINGFNPCSISLLLFLITLLLARNANVLKLGLAFLLGKFLAYLALGTLLFNALALVDGSTMKLFTGVIKVVLVIIVLAAAALNVSDFVAARNEQYNRIRVQLPVWLRKLNHQWLKVLEKTGGGWLPLMTFVLGIAISVGEFLCTGQIYLATILYLIKRGATFEWHTFGAFLLYIAGMLLPLLVIMLAVYKGKAVFNLSELVRRNMPIIKLTTAAIFVLFAILLLVI